LTKTENPRDGSSAYGKQIEKLTWCSACKQGFSESDYPSFAYTQCPLCGKSPPEGFLPWSWVRAQWHKRLPPIPEPGVRYEAHPRKE